MNYEKHYEQLIETRKYRLLLEDEYYEQHHIVPKCLGGTDDAENLIYLTAREHFIAHWLLYKMTNDKFAKAKLGLAWRYMLYGKGKTKQNRKFNSRSFELARKAFAESISILQTERLSIPENNPFYGKTHTDEVKEKISEAMIGIEPWNKNKKGCYSEEQLLRMSIWQKGLSFDEKFGEERSKEIKEKISKATIGENNPMFGRRGELAPCFGRTGDLHPMYGKHRSDETKKKISESSKGKKHSEDSIQKMKEKYAQREKVICPHCGKVGVKSALIRWHFDNCKKKEK